MKRVPKTGQRCEPATSYPDFEIVDDALPVNSKITLAGISIERIEIEVNEGTPLVDIERLEADLKYAREGIVGLRKQKDFWETAAHDRTEERNEHGRKAVGLAEVNKRQGVVIKILRTKLDRLMPKASTTTPKQKKGAKRR